MPDKNTPESVAPTFLLDASDISSGSPCFIELRHLRCFDAVARSLNFTKAAEHLHTGQPALSRTIMQLEEQLGCQVFARSGPNIRLTNAGHVLARHAEELLRAWDNAVTATRHAAQGVAGSLAIGVTSSTMMGELPDLIAKFRSERPLIDVQLHEIEVDEVFSPRHGEELDVRFFYSRSNQVPPGIRVLHGEPMFVAMREAHPLSAQNSIALPMLNGENLILSLTNEPFSVGSSINVHETGNCRPHSIKCVSNVLTALGMVASGFGITAVIQPQRLHIRGIKYIPLVPQHQFVAYLTVFWNRTNENPVLPHFLQTFGLKVSGARIRQPDEKLEVRAERFEAE